MKRTVVWAFLFIILVLLTAQVIQSNREELTRHFAFQINLPFVGSYQSVYAPSVAAYFAICLLLGGFVVMLISLVAVIRANQQAKEARRELAEVRAEMRRLRGPAEDDEVYQAPGDV